MDFVAGVSSGVPFMLRKPNLSRQRRGIAVIECAILAPLLIILLFGIWEVGRLIQIGQLVANAAREGARQASSAKYNINQVRQATFEYLKNSRVPLHDTLNSSTVTLATTNITITVTNLDGTETLDADQFDRMEVVVTVPLRNFRWLASNQFAGTATSFTSRASFLCLKDNPISVSSTIPQQPLP